MDIVGNCLVPHQRCQQLQVGGKIVGGSTINSSKLRDPCKCVEESSDEFHSN